MRMAIVAGLMAVGLLAGCGGPEVDEAVSKDETGQVDQGVTRIECIDACDAKWYGCIYAPNGPPRYTCDTNRAFCVSQCPP